MQNEYTTHRVGIKKNPKSPIEKTEATIDPDDRAAVVIILAIKDPIAIIRKDFRNQWYLEIRAGKTMEPMTPMITKQAPSMLVCTES